MSFLAVDLGTTFIKGAVLDLDALRLRRVRRRPFPPFLAGLAPAHREVDPQAVLAATRELIQELLQDGERCDGLVMCGQMHGLVLTDEHGTALTNCISWQDERALQPHSSGRPFFDLLSERIPPAERLQLGNELRPSLPVCFLFTLAEQGRLPAGARPLSLPDFVLAHLCQAEPRTGLTMAAAHGALNLESQTWHTAVLKRLGLDLLRWPEICPPESPVGLLRAGAREFPCYVAIGDQQCALAGVGLEAGELSLNISTGSQVGMIVERFLPGDCQVRPFPDGRFLNTVTHLPAGRALNALIRLLSELAGWQGARPDDPWPAIAGAVGRVENSDVKVNLAFFPGASGHTGEILNLREDNMTVGHVFRAAFDSMAENYFAAAVRICPGRSWPRLVLSGGLARKLDPLRDAITRRFRCEWRVAASPEDTLLGLMAQASVIHSRACLTWADAMKRVRDMPAPGPE